MRMSSMAKSTPAIGVLNVAEMPPAAPQPRRIFMWAVFILSRWAMLEPRAEPMWTMGPSRPEEPPIPMVTADASALMTITRNLSRPPCRVTASMTSGTPWPFASRAPQ
jgi:hypothetical protein